LFQNIFKAEYLKMIYRRLFVTVVVLLINSHAYATDQKTEALRAGGAVAVGAAAGGGVFAAVGAGGLAIAGTAVTVGLAPFVAAGAVVGLAGYGVYRLATDSNPIAQASEKPTKPTGSGASSKK
jgi:hypothetical protein